MYRYKGLEWTDVQSDGTNLYNKFFRSRYMRMVSYFMEVIVIHRFIKNRSGL